jgi:thiol-disulfide isomerase/thioredoxin
MKLLKASLLYIFFITFQIKSQNINLEITENVTTPYLIGKIDKSGLESRSYKSWFATNYEAYKTDGKLIKAISPELKEYKISLFMGTWCGDSKKEVPRLYKVLEASNFPMEQLSVIAVSGEASLYKQSPQHEEKGLNIHRVPTVIFYKNGKEVNRIVEHPISSFEKDIFNIITKNDYKSNYQIVTTIHRILKTKGVQGLKNKEKMILNAFNGKVSSMYELNTYGRVLFSSNQKEQAIAVFELNTKLFSDQPRTYMSLANTLGAMGYKNKAVKVLEDAIILHQNNTDLKDNLIVIKTN